MLRAEALADRGAFEEAKATVLAHSNRPAVLRFLIDMATRQDDYHGARRLSEQLAQLTKEGRDRLALAALKARGKKHTEGSQEFLVLARDARVADAVRNQAFQASAEIALKAEDFQLAADIVGEWRLVIPESEDAFWLELYTQNRRGNQSAAAHLYLNDRRPPQTMERALIAAEALALGAAPLDAVPEIARLSEEFERPERLEFTLIQVSLRLTAEEREDLPESCAERIRDGLATFPDRFPDSVFLRAYSIDEDDPVASLAEILKDQPQRGEPEKELLNGIDGGTAPIAALAAAIGSKTVGEVCLRLGSLPMGYSDNVLEDLEREDARQALSGHAAAVDPVALYVIGGLGDLGRRVLATLPAAVIPQSVLDEGLRDLSAPREPSSLQLGLDPESGDVVKVELPPEHVAREASRAAGAVELVRELRVVPDAPSESRSELESLLEKDLDPSFAALIATLAVGRREEIPVYSDDRHVRLIARQLGLRAFGSLALLTVLSEQGSLSADELGEARLTFLRSGAWGVRPSPQELVELVRESAWDIDQGLVAICFDRAAWQAEPTKQLEALFGVLEDVFSNAPANLCKWVHRVVDAPAKVFGISYEKSAIAALPPALNPLADPLRVSDEVLQALIECMRAMDYFQVFPPQEDLVLAALRKSLSLVEGASGDSELRAQTLFFKLAIERLSAEDRERAWKTFVR